MKAYEVRERKHHLPFLTIKIIEYTIYTYMHYIFVLHTLANESLEYDHASGSLRSKFHCVSAMTRWLFSHKQFEENIKPRVIQRMETQLCWLTAILRSWGRPRQSPMVCSVCPTEVVRVAFIFDFLLFYVLSPWVPDGQVIEAWFGSPRRRSHTFCVGRCSLGVVIGWCHGWRRIRMTHSQIL